MKIPRIIHQIWSGIDEPLPKRFKILGATWKEYHPGWRYEFWDNERINNFILENYPQYMTLYNQLKYNIQRWDVIRYLILYKIGGVYVDFDYECIAPLDNLLEKKICCFSSEPIEHAMSFGKGIYFNNALMSSVPKNLFMKLIIENIFNPAKEIKEYSDKMIEVLETTGPFLLTHLYESYDKKEDIYIIPAELVSPLSKTDVALFLQTQDASMNEWLEKKLEKAVAIHYFIGGWL
jgi:mannosyltransferase OCH1-like enzyme